ncbi:hypothetical protein [Roseivivax sp. CAU 1753]
MVKTDRNGSDDAGLEAFFVAARAQPPEPGPGFLARVSAQAEAEARAHGDARHAARRSAGRGPLAVLRDAIGGWPALAGLGFAACAGVWIGIAPPDGIAASVATLWSGDTALSAYPDPSAGFETLLAEG